MDEHGTVGHGPLDYLYQRFTSFIEERRRNPQSDDVMTAMATATFPDGSLPEVRDVMLIATNLFAAGQETTARLLGVMFQRIGERPELQQLLRDERDRIPNFIEECLRLGTPIQCTFRLARVSTKIGGVPIPAGTTVMLIPAAANRDPRQFEAPNEFRLGRPNWRQHLTFGSGVHSCAGAPLARAEARISAERLLDRLADIRISEKAHGPAGARRYQYSNIYMLRGLDRLHLEFTPVG
jgi:cytochrome P450